MNRQFGDLEASELYCPKCGRSQPVRERLLLILPTGEIHEYRCARCLTSLGQRTVTGPAIQGARPAPAAHPRPRPPAARPRPVRGLLG
ncbi:MAG: hypothetical protein H7A46_17450 [Verrucomicrobiales bacterium]|nr:hypothetical protein [Verrucomicrobiales bacterium]